MKPRLLGAIATLALVMVGCGVPVDDGARSIDPDAVPFDLLDRSRVTTTTVSGTAPVAEVFLVAGDRLVGVRRAVTGATSLQTRLDALLDGPTEQEARLGISTALPVGGDLPSTVSGSTARIDLGEAFGVPGLEQVFAIAQLVFTATALDPVDRVLFFVGGRRVDVPAQDGTLKAEPLTRRDFATLAPS
jgi:hypothetical protein